MPKAISSTHFLTKSRGLDALGVFAIGGMEGRFVRLESVPSIFVKLVNVVIRFLEHFKRASEIPVVNASTHSYTLKACSVFLLVLTRVHGANHVELPGD